MKLAVTFLVSTLASDVRHARQASEERRYSQLLDQMEFFNADFDERKYFLYGCHCAVTGDAPMSSMGHGAPLDALDAVCRAYKECQKCVRLVHGDSCVGEVIRYSHRIAGGNSICRDDDGTCGRALCECDKAFAMAHDAVKDEFSTDYHHLWSSPSFVSDTMCVSSNSDGPSDPQCCNDYSHSGPFILYNALTKQCCSDGTVENIGQC